MGRRTYTLTPTGEILFAKGGPGSIKHGGKARLGVDKRGRTHWRDVPLSSATGGSVSDADRKHAMREFRDTGAIRDYYTCPGGKGCKDDRHEEHGPKKRHVDFSGLDDGEDGGTPPPPSGSSHPGMVGHGSYPSRKRRRFVEREQAAELAERKDPSRRAKRIASQRPYPSQKRDDEDDPARYTPDSATWEKPGFRYVAKSIFTLRGGRRLRDFIAKATQFDLFGGPKEIKEPGKKGGKFYRTKKSGKVRYGTQPTAHPGTAVATSPASDPAFVEKHLTAWLERSVHSDEREAVGKKIRAYIAKHPKAVNDLGWPEIRALVQREENEGGGYEQPVGTWTVELTKTSPTSSIWGYFTKNPKGGGGGSSNRGSLDTALRRALRADIPPGSKIVVKVNGKVRGTFDSKEAALAGYKGGGKTPTGYNLDDPNAQGRGFSKRDQVEAETREGMKKKAEPECAFCHRSGPGVQFAIFNPRFKPFGTACTDCEAKLPEGTKVPGSEGGGGTMTEKRTWTSESGNSFTLTKRGRGGISGTNRRVAVGPSERREQAASDASSEATAKLERKIKALNRKLKQARDRIRFASDLAMNDGGSSERREQAAFDKLYDEKKALEKQLAGGGGASAAGSGASDAATRNAMGDMPPPIKFGSGPGSAGGGDGDDDDPKELPVPKGTPEAKGSKHTALLPAYGRDYKNGEAAAKDFLSNAKDFIIANIQDRYDGKPALMGDLIEAGYGKFEIRFNQKRDVVFVDLNKRKIML